MKNLWKRLYVFFLTDLWALDRSSLGRLRAFLVHALQIATVVVRDVLYGEVTLRAMGLVYTTMLSLVPLLAVSFSVLKAFGAHNKLEPFLFNLVAPLGPAGIELAQRIVGFVDNMKVGVLGSIGLALLFYTVISLIQKMEEAFNSLWRVRSLRGVLQRFSEYLSVILVGPVLVVTALGLTASFMATALMRRLTAVEPIGSVVAYAGELVPYLLVCAAFTFMYLFVPNTRVKFSAALIGGVIGGVLWETLGWGFASFIVAATRYAAIYSGFAILMLFMIWLYLSWLILLIGAEISFYYQNPQFLSLGPRTRVPDARTIERTAVAVMFLIADHFYHGKTPWSFNALAQRLGLDVDLVGDVVNALQGRQLIVETAGDPQAYLPARDIETIALRDVYDAVRGSGRGGFAAPAAGSLEAVDRIVEAIDDAVRGTLGEKTLRDIVLGGAAVETTV
jgi:membrane protein